MTAGILANELLQDYTNVMKERVESFVVLQRHYLPHQVVSPMDLKTILNKLITLLSGQHPFFSYIVKTFTPTIALEMLISIYKKTNISYRYQECMIRNLDYTIYNQFIYHYRIKKTNG